MRLYGIRPTDVDSAVAHPRQTDEDEYGNPRLTGLDGDGRAIIVIRLVGEERAERAEQAHPRAIAALSGDRPIELQLLYPDLGVEEPLRIVAERYALDPEAMIAAAKAVLTAPSPST